jgi:hypothetical protein
VKTIQQTPLLRSFAPYLLLSLAGVADLATSLFGVNMAGLTEGNPHFTPFLTEIVLIIYIFAIRKIPIVPKRTERLCETALVLFSFAPAIWNLALIMGTFS